MKILKCVCREEERSASILQVKRNDFFEAIHHWNIVDLKKKMCPNHADDNYQRHHKRYKTNLSAENGCQKHHQNKSKLDKNINKCKLNKLNIFCCNRSFFLNFFPNRKCNRVIKPSGCESPFFVVCFSMVGHCTIFAPLTTCVVIANFVGRSDMA